MPTAQSAETETLIRLDKKVEGLEQHARDLAGSVEAVRRQTLQQTNERIEALEQKARDLACFVETTRQQTLVKADKKTHALEQKARDLADFVETLRNQTRVQSETEIEALGQKARDLALFVETVRDETRLQSQAEIAALGQKARDLAVAVETVREETLLQSDTQIAALGQQARDLALSVETIREETLLQSRETDKVTRKLNEELEQHVLNRTAELQVANSTLVDFKAALDEHAIVAITDGRGVITYVNDKFCAISKYSREELIGHDHRIINSGHHPKAFILNLWHTITNGTVWHGEIKNRAKDGSYYWVDTTIVPLLGTDGEPSQHIAIRADITQRKQKEEQIFDLNTELLQRADQLETANKELEAFSYSVSHDLRSPVRSIQGFSRILLEEHATQLPAEVQEYLQDIRRNSVRMGHLIDDLLTFSRLSRQDLQTREVSPSQVVNQVLDELRTEREGRDVKIDVGELLPCQADPALLKQVWINLLANALKYSRKTAAARIEVGCRVQDKECVYFVRDNGVGFAMQYAGKLFGVFQRMHTAAEYEGTGVGLAIVQRIVNRHGGRIWAESTLNQGATFSFTIPSLATH